ncbi:Fatty acid desaturase [Minicystis rosea]|nr:Fatty acid desaturase [Minicystis rosea]
MGVRAVHPDDRIEWLRSSPFLLVHVAAVVGVVWMGFSWSGLALAAALYVTRMFGVTAGYHRYFSHRSFETSRAFAFVLGVLAESSAQKGVIWWASHHRRHHKYSDTTEDVHSMKQRGFFWSHVGWILAPRWKDIEWERVSDLARRPELRWLDRWYLLPPIALAIGLFLAGGAHALLWGFFVSTVLTWHGTFVINSLAHHIGRRRYGTDDESRNSLTLAIVAMGEGWHNNHHHYQRSARQGFFWWEIDVTYYALRILELLGLVWNVHQPPGAVRARTLEAARRSVATEGALTSPLAERGPRRAAAG